MPLYNQQILTWKVFKHSYVTIDPNHDAPLHIVVYWIGGATR